MGEVLMASAEWGMQLGEVRKQRLSMPIPNTDIVGAEVLRGSVTEQCFPRCFHRMK